MRTDANDGLLSIPHQMKSMSTSVVVARYRPCSIRMTMPVSNFHNINNLCNVYYNRINIIIFVATTVDGVGEQVIIDYILKHGYNGDGSQSKSFLKRLAHKFGIDCKSDPEIAKLKGELLFLFIYFPSISICFYFLFSNHEKGVEYGCQE